MDASTEELVVITGSSNKFGKEIYALAEKLRKEGKTVIVDSIFHSMPEWKSRRQFIKMILDADTLLVFNKNGYVGFHTRFEALLAEMCGVKVKHLFAGRAVSLADVEKVYYDNL